MNDCKYQVEIIERELVDVRLIEKELIDISLNTVDILQREIVTIVTSIFNEIPTQITSKKFRTDYDFKPGTLRVFFNGIKEKYIVETGANEFTLPIDAIVGDVFETHYQKA